VAINRNSTSIIVSVLIVFGLAIISLGFVFLWVESTNSNHTIEDRLWVSPTEIKSISWDESTSQIRVLVEYTANGNVTLEAVYANETLDAEAVIGTRVLSKGQTAEITLSEKYATKPTQITVRVATSDGLDAFKAKTFYAITLEQVDWDEKTSKIRFVVKNYGDETVTLSEVYVNGTLDASAMPNPKILQTNQKAVVTLSGTYTDTHVAIPIKVMTMEGAANECSSPIYGIWIQSINWNHGTGEIIAYVYSNGYENVNVSGVYVNGTLDATAKILMTSHANDFWTIKLSKTYASNPPDFTLKVVTSDGALAELTTWHLNEF
jgi:hypothetical protein